jgi:hypothetical protein
MNKEIVKGLYEIVNKSNNNRYIGISSNIYNRWNQHKEMLENNNHHQRGLQTEYNELKKECKDNTINQYEFRIIKQVAIFDKNEMQLLEDKYILKYRDIQLGYCQKTNFELYADHRKGYIDKEYYAEHKKLYDDYYKMRKERTKERIKNNRKWQILKLEYDNNCIYSEWIYDLRMIPTLSYFYNNNKDLIKVNFDNISLKEIQDYSYYNIPIANIRDTLKMLYKNKLLEIKGDININKIRKNDIFSIELIKVSNLIGLIQSFFLCSRVRFILNDEEFNY